MRFAFVCLVAALASAAGCKRPEDQAAKARIFSPEQPSGVDAKAREKLDARRLADDPAAAERVLRMSRAEVATRLGAHKLAGKTELSWTLGGPVSPDAGPSGVALIEETSLQQASSGDFRARLENDRNQGFEAVWSGGEVFVKSRFGPFRKRRTDRSDPPRLREQTSASLATFDQLARGLKLRLAGDATVEGHRAVKYDVVGAGARTKKAEAPDAPPIQWPEPANQPKGAAAAPDPDTARRLSLWEKQEPVEVSGFVTVDAETAAPLAYDLRGEFRVQQPSGPVAELSLHATLRTSALGKEIAIKPPEVEPEPSVPHAVKDPLRFLGKDATAAAIEAAAIEAAEEEGAAEEEVAEPESGDATERSAPATPPPAAAPKSKPR